MLEFRWSRNCLFCYYFLIFVFFINCGFSDCRLLLHSKTKQLNGLESNFLSDLYSTSPSWESNRVVSRATGSNNCENTKKGPTFPNVNFRFYKLGNSTQFNSCLDLCCAKSSCHLAFFSNSRCFALECYKPEACRDVLDKLLFRNQDLQTTTADGSSFGMLIS